MKKYLTLLSILIILFASHSKIFAQASSLDSSFGNSGIVTTSILSKDIGYGSVIQTDGKILMVGVSSDNINNYFSLVRYHIDGSLDSTFDNDGKVTTMGGTGYSVAIQANNKIVVVGYSYNGSNNDFAIHRYNSNGSLDTTFNHDGKVITDFGSQDLASDLAIQSDGKIVVVGYTYIGSNRVLAVTRYNVNGNLDSTFNGNGISTLAIGTENIGSEIAIQPDGKTVVTGICQFGLQVDFFTVRYTTNGSLDSTFDNDGIVTTDYGNYNNFAYSILIQNDGKIIVGGYSLIGSHHDFTLVRYNINGALDTSFNNIGIVNLLLATSNDFGHSLAIQSDNKILMAGYSYNGTKNNFAVIRYNTNGSVDTTFDIDGIINTSIDTFSSQATNILLQSDNKILVTGTYEDDMYKGFALARFNNNMNVGIKESITELNKINIYPNPFSKFTTIEINTFLKNASLKVNNIYGQQVKQLNNLSGKQFTFYRADLPQGLYFTQLIEKNQLISTSKFIIE